MLHLPTPAGAASALGGHKVYHYCVFNLRISSEVELPALPHSPNGGDVIVHLTASAPHVGPPPGMASSYHVTPRLATLDFAELGTLVVREGHDIGITLLPGADLAPLQHYLVGLALAVLLYQRGLVVLEASALQAGPGAIMLVGDPASARASLSTALLARGYTLIGDEITAISMSGPYAQIIPAFPAPRAPAAATAESTTPALRPVEEVDQPVPVPLHAIYQLKSGAKQYVSRLPPQAALTEIVRYSYPIRLLQPGGIDHLRQCSQLVGAVAVYQLTQADDPLALPELAQLIDTRAALVRPRGDHARFAPPIVRTRRRSPKPSPESH